jgi:hypothetical protein
MLCIQVVFGWCAEGISLHGKVIMKLIYLKTLLHIVPFCEGPNKKIEGFAKEKQKT